MKNVRKMVTDWMDVNGITKVELADQMGISEALVRAFLNGERRITAKRLDELALITGMSVNELLGVDKKEVAGYTVMLRGGSGKLTAAQEKSIMDAALLANDYERLRSVILHEKQVNQYE